MMQQPSRRDVMRPYEYLAIAAAIALFCGLIFLATTRDIVIAVVGAGVIFILALVTLALLALAMKPDDKELTDLEEQQRREEPGAPH
ncbi:hypothetical protein OH146_08340 [Salinibacterium sp. SYSU T00001]|uniref:hypothetical protein n=1 Tax=Homoserinimonas sedimenticola TaxID=2986805 RepID=UPI002235576A|nr:hypothetical protein [Salinibacterium sedimenticola]MCW4385783.1 hypothetical protein [Salinibacterium sedimenticola]